MPKIKTLMTLRLPGADKDTKRGTVVEVDAQFARDAIAFGQAEAVPSGTTKADS
jgi:hypothetical protein